MEGIGSRLGRASSRYGPAATVFNGPVRRWRKKWVHVASSSAVSYQNSGQAQSNGHKVLLCRWTPVPATSAAETDGSSGAPAEPPRRKFRYTPIAVLEEKKSAGTKKAENEVKMNESRQSMAYSTTSGDVTPGKLNVNEVFKEETQEMDRKLFNLQAARGSQLDLELCLKGQNGNQDSVG